MLIVNNNTGVSILVMLSSDACSPCYTFGNHKEKREVLSGAYLRDILVWAAEAEPVMPELFFLVGHAQNIDFECGDNNCVMAEGAAGWEFCDSHKNALRNTSAW